MSKKSPEQKKHAEQRRKELKQEAAAYHKKIAEPHAPAVKVKPTLDDRVADRLRDRSEHPEKYTDLPVIQTRKFSGDDAKLAFLE